MELDKEIYKYIDRISALIALSIASTVALIVVIIGWASGAFDKEPLNGGPTAFDMGNTQATTWRAPDFSVIHDDTKLKQVEYGKELIAHTSYYLGPRGTVRKMSNGMNCQNCHLEAGTKPFGNNYAAAASTYPRFRARSGSVESLEKRVNDCFERSLNGLPLNTASTEMNAIVSYIKFLGSNVDAANMPQGTGMKKIQLLDRAADPVNGLQLYEEHCATCHGKNGEGMMRSDGQEYQFPPLWGGHSFNTGAGLFRLSNFAQFIHANMPLGATFDKPILSEAQAWDIAAYVNSLPRPAKDLSGDWPRPETKPFDHPFGPFADTFSEQQHKYGPFKDILKFYAKHDKE